MQNIKICKFSSITTSCRLPYPQTVTASWKVGKAPNSDSLSVREIQVSLKFSPLTSRSLLSLTRNICNVKPVAAGCCCNVDSGRPILRVFLFSEARLMWLDYWNLQGENCKIYNAWLHKWLESLKNWKRIKMISVEQPVKLPDSVYLHPVPVPGLAKVCESDDAAAVGQEGHVAQDHWVGLLLYTWSGCWSKRKYLAKVGAVPTIYCGILYCGNFLPNLRYVVLR